jgi:multidrug efflux system outer membrane protein
VRRNALLAGAALLAGCSFAPNLAVPETGGPAAWKEAPAQLPGDWKLAAPADDVSRGAWWEAFRDPVLTGLVTRATAGNFGLAEALARLEQSRAQLRVARAAQRPRIDLGANAARIQPSQLPPLGLPRGAFEDYNELGAGLTASYELDLFGRVRDSVTAARADLDAQRALAASLALSVQADVAERYFQIRAADGELAVLRGSVGLREESLRLLRLRMAAGDLGELELRQQESELETARAEIQAVMRTRAQYEHALAVLCGEVPAAFALAPVKSERHLPVVPAGLPSTLLERRPDIAAAERRMVAANARIGVAKAAFYPVLNLTANFGVRAASLGDLFKWSSRVWALGPVAGSLLSLPIFNGGRNAANLAAVEATLDAESAVYRQTVLMAFGEVEDGLSGLRTLAAQATAIQAAINAAGAAHRLARARHAAGATSYLEVLDARRALVAARRQDAQVNGARAATTVALVRALGGGW